MASEHYTLLGVVIGGLISFATASLLERQRARRENATRWLNAALDACTDYVTAVKEAARYARWLMEEKESVGYAGNDPSTARRSLAAEMEEAEHRRSLHFERVVLLVSERTRRKGGELNQALWALFEVREREGGLSPEEWNERNSRWLEDLNQFHDAVREDLGVSLRFRNRNAST